jgi:DNA adenine methylase
VRPPTTYYGGKTRLAGWIASLLPAHRTYLEPFCTPPTFAQECRSRYDARSSSGGHYRPAQDQESLSPALTAVRRPIVHSSTPAGITLCGGTRHGVRAGIRGLSRPVTSLRVNSYGRESGLSVGGAIWVGLPDVLEQACSNGCLRANGRDGQHQWPHLACITQRSAHRVSGIQDGPSGGCLDGCDGEHRRDCDVGQQVNCRIKQLLCRLDPALAPTLVLGPRNRLCGELLCRVDENLDVYLNHWNDAVALRLHNVLLIGFVRTARGFGKQVGNQSPQSHSRTCLALLSGVSICRFFSGSLLNRRLDRGPHVLIREHRAQVAQRHPNNGEVLVAGRLLVETFPRITENAPGIHQASQVDVLGMGFALGHRTPSSVRDALRQNRTIPGPTYGVKGLRTGLPLGPVLDPSSQGVPTPVGSAAVLFAKPPSPTEVLNDLDGQVVNFFRILRNQPAELARALTLSPYAWVEYEQVPTGYDDPGLAEVERARRWFVRVNQSISHLAGRGRPSGWAAAYNTNGADHAHKFAALADRLEVCAERLRRVHLECWPAAEVIAKYAKPAADAVLYCDPPYLAEVCSARTKRVAGDYAVEYASEAEHRALAQVLHATPATVVLSGYPSRLYEELYGGWWRMERSVHRPTSNVSGGRGAVAVEVLWSNRPLAAQLQLAAPAEQTAEGWSG